jgi:uncharacterized repeat protein (TIGR02543 family)
MKKRASILIVIIISLIALAACKSGPKVSFNMPDGSVYNLTAGEDATLPAPTREGYTFGGWFLDQDYQTELTEAMLRDGSITEDVTVYAKWNPMTNTVTFVTNGGESIDPKSVNIGNKLQVPFAPYRYGYVLEGWYTDNETFTNAFDFNSVVSEAVTLYAKWTEVPETAGLNYSLIAGGTQYTVSVGTATMSEVIMIPVSHNSLPVTAVSTDGFFYSNMSTLFIPDTVTDIGMSAFSACDNLESLYLPDSVNTIGIYAFSTCVDLSRITVDADNTVYKSEGNCIINRYTNTLIAGCKGSVIPSSVTSIGAGAFYGHSDYDELVLPSGITTIGEWAFSGCEFKEIAISYGVTTIGNSAFYYCLELTDVTLPATVTSIGYNAFYGCEELENFTIQAQIPPTLGNYVFLGSTDNLTIYVPSGKLSDYTGASGWSEYAEYIQTY